MQHRSTFRIFAFTPLFDQFPDFFQNSLAFFTHRVTESYTGDCLRIMHSATLIEVDIGFILYEGAYWIDNAAIADFLTDQGEGELFIIRGYLQGIGEDGSLFATPPTLGNALTLVLGDTPKGTHILVNGTNIYMNYNGIQRKSIRENIGTKEYVYTDKYKALDLFVIDEDYTSNFEHMLVRENSATNHRVARNLGFTRMQTRIYTGGMANDTNQYAEGERMSLDIPYSASDKKGAVLYYYENDGTNTVDGNKFRFIYKDWKHKLRTVAKAPANRFDPQISFLGPSSGQTSNYKAYGWLRAHEVEDNFTGMDPDKLLEINRAVNKVYNITENEYLAI